MSTFTKARRNALLARIAPSAEETRKNRLRLEALVAELRVDGITKGLTGKKLKKYITGEIEIPRY